MSGNGIWFLLGLIFVFGVVPALFFGGLQFGLRRLTAGRFDRLPVILQAVVVLMAAFLVLRTCSVLHEASSSGGGVASRARLR